jgi:hypothetical protein
VLKNHLKKWSKEKKKNNSLLIKKAADNAHMSMGQVLQSGQFTLEFKIYNRWGHIFTMNLEARTFMQFSFTRIGLLLLTSILLLFPSQSYSSVGYIEQVKTEMLVYNSTKRRLEVPLNLRRNKTKASKQSFRNYKGRKPNRIKKQHYNFSYIFVMLAIPPILLLVGSLMLILGLNIFAFWITGIVLICLFIIAAFGVVLIWPPNAFIYWYYGLMSSLVGAMFLIWGLFALSAVFWGIGIALLAFGLFYLIFILIARNQAKK